MSDNTPTVLTHTGFYAEIVNVSMLIKINDLELPSVYKEHVTNYLYQNPDMFNVQLRQLDRDFDVNNIRLTIDDLSDFELSKILYNHKEEHNLSNQELLIFIKNSPRILADMRSSILKNTK